MEKEIYSAYVRLLEQELVPAMGCTEPIAVAYAAAVAAQQLGTRPEHVRITVSSNIIKNVKSVIVPNTGGLHGLEAAAAAGITASVPVIVCAEALGASREQLYRALVVSNLVTLHLKSGIGPLSAYCGAISAGCGAAAGVTYLYGGKFREIAHTVVNAIAIKSGVICDGAKASCAAKVASAVEAGLLGMEMFRQGIQFVGGDGIVSKGVENTIRNVSQLASQGMRKTNSEIIKIMLAKL